MVMVFASMFLVFRLGFNVVISLLKICHFDHLNRGICVKV